MTSSQASVLISCLQIKEYAIQCFSAEGSHDFHLMLRVAVVLVHGNIEFVEVEVEDGCFRPRNEQRQL